MTKKKSEIDQNLKLARKVIDSDKTLSPAIKAIFELLFSLVTELIKQRNVNSKNSSTPPSQDPFRKKSKSSGSTRTKTNSDGETLRKIESPDKVIDHFPKGHCICGTSLKRSKSLSFRSRQVWDLIIKTEVQEHRVHDVQCTCGRSHSGSFPLGVVNNAQYSEKVRAIASYLSQYQLIPVERTQEVFRDIFGLNIATGTICNSNSALFHKLSSFEEKLRDTLVNTEVCHSDETGINVAGKINYLHVFSSQYHTFLSAHETRGRKALDEMGLLTRFKGVLVHDFYSVYWQFKCRHAFCGSHLIRELIFSEEEEDQYWAKKMRQLMQYSNYLKKKGRLTLSVREHIYKAYDEILLVANMECPRGKKRKRSKSRCLLDRFVLRQRDILRFLRYSEVPFTNNLAERDLRMAKVHQKISGCFRSLQGARVYARIRSYISTIKKQKINILEGIVDAFKGSFLTQNRLFG
jgi:transposase